MKYRIGLDLGIASVGWSVLEHDINDKPCRIVDLGVRVFDAAENPKDGTSLSVDRRNARGSRRRLRRRANRMVKIRALLGKILFGDEAKLVEPKLNILEYRYKGINEQLSKDDLYLVVAYLVKHRGFKSNRKAELKEKETGKLNKIIKENGLAADSYKTIGEYIYCSSRFVVTAKNDDKEYKEYRYRNHGNYDNSFSRSEIEKELKEILHTQAKFYSAELTEDNIKNILDIFNLQRNYDDGPNEPSPYRTDYAVGKCTLMPQYLRAPKGSFTFEYFNALQKINSLTILDHDRQEIKLTEEQRTEIIARLFAGDNIKYSHVRKLLKLSDDERFKNLTYKKKKEEVDGVERWSIDIKKTEDKAFICFNKTKDMANALGVKVISKEDAELYDAIAYILSMRKSDDRRIEALELKDKIDDNLSARQRELIKQLSRDDINKLLEVDMSKFGNLSIEAMNAIIQYLEQGMVYSQACEAAGLDFRAISKCDKKLKLHYNDLIEELADINSPVVKRTISQTIKVINAIIDKYGSPAAIFIEFARELALNIKDREKIKKAQDNRAADNERLKQRLISEFQITNPSGLDIVKLRLYEEQGGKCAYSGKSFDAVLGSPAAIFNNNNTQIDHIIPYSKCFDDSYNNKVLVLSDENQKKGNRVPMEYMAPEQYKAFEEFVISQYKDNLKKQANLLHKPLSEEQITELNSRALNDTRYTARLIKQVLEAHLQFADSGLSKKPVRCVNGRITSYLRKIWGLTKERFASDKHHAQDAAVIAVSTNGMIQDITRYFQLKSYKTQQGALAIRVIDGNKYVIITSTGESMLSDEYDRQFGAKIKQPYNYFSDEIKARLWSTDPQNEAYLETYKNIGYTSEEIDAIKPVFISRMPTRKVLGRIHEDTITSPIYQKQDKRNYTCVRTSLSKLSLSSDGEIKGYSEQAKKDDKLLYNALKARLAQFGGKGEDAFKEPFYKPKSDGTPGNIVRSVKIESYASDYISLSRGTASNDGMVRLDVFEKDGKNYIVPVYTKDAYSGVLPNLAVVALKPKEQWIDVSNGDYKFKFSLYKNDLVYSPNFEEFDGTDDKNKKAIAHTRYLYYKGADRSTGSISFINNDGSISFRKYIQKISDIRKCQVDVLGNISFVKHNVRQEFNIKNKGSKKWDISI